MKKQQYLDDCDGCKRSQGKLDPPPMGGIIELEDDWILNHFGGGGFLGWLVLQTKFHRMDLAELCSQEIAAFGKNIQLIDKVLRLYWSEIYPDDPIERLYIIYFFESRFVPSEHEHLHCHLIPRTRKLGKNNKGDYKPWDVAAWKIAELPNQSYFPDEYRIRDKSGHKINTEKVIALVQYLREHLTSDT